MRDMTRTGPTLASPPWTNDFLGREHLVPGGSKLDAAQFEGADAVVVEVTANAAIGAVTVAVAALAGAIPTGTMLDFTGAGKYARLTAAAAKGATSLTVEALVQALVAGDEATYLGTGRKRVASGTVVGRTLAERDAATGYGPADAADDEIFIVAFDVDDVNHINDVELVRHNTTLKENFLPGWAGLAAGVQTAVRNRYICMRGAE